MSYLRVDYKGEMRFVTDNKLLQSIAENHGQILVVTGDTLRSRELWLSVLDFKGVLGGSLANQFVHTQQSTISISSPFDWMRYAGLELSSAYVHRDATLNFLLQIMSKCRVEPEVLQSNNT